MKISICITVINEESSIGKLLDSLLTQTIKANEIIIVDGGSVDKTVEIIKHYSKKDNSIRYLIEKGGIAHGRNTAIEVARFPIIAQIDAGCVARKNWLEKLTAPFMHENVGLVAGFYEMLADNPLQEAMNVFHGTPPERFDPENFLPSARSVAFRRQLWETVGGYNEKLKKAGEDTLFFYNCVKTKCRIVRVGEAKVIWEETRTFNLIDSLRKFRSYAVGDAVTGIWWHPTKQLASHNIKISLIFVRYLFALFILIFSFKLPLLAYLLAFLFISYVFWSIYKWRDIIFDWRARVYLPIVQISSDIAVMTGFISGLIVQSSHGKSR